MEHDGKGYSSVVIRSERGSIRLCGEYYIKLDEDYRLLLPRPFKEFISNDEIIIISVACPDCQAPISCQNLVFIPSRALKSWVLEELPRYEKNCGIKKVVAFYERVRLDKRGRITIPRRFRSKIPRQAVLIGVRDQFELWPEVAWEKYLSANEMVFRSP